MFSCFLGDALHHEDCGLVLIKLQK